jgi:hypothetical protein
MGSWRGLLFFSGRMLTHFLSVSMSIQRRFHASPGLMPVSLSNWRKAAVFLPHPEMMAPCSDF